MVYGWRLKPERIKNYLINVVSIFAMTLQPNIFNITKIHFYFFHVVTHLLRNTEVISRIFRTLEILIERKFSKVTRNDFGISE